MKFLGTFQSVYETHEVKPNLRDIAIFVTLNDAKLYPREQNPHRNLPNQV